MQLKQLSQSYLSSASSSSSSLETKARHADLVYVYITSTFDAIFTVSILAVTVWLLMN